MKLNYNKHYAEGEFDMDTIELVAIPARPSKHERHPLICITEGEHCMNFQIAFLDFGSLEDENAMAKEIARRWNLAKKRGDVCHNCEHLIYDQDVTGNHFPYCKKYEVGLEPTLMNEHFDWCTDFKEKEGGEKCSQS